MDALLKKIDDSRNIKSNTLRAYGINLRKTHESVGDGEFNTKFLSKTQSVMKFLEKFALPTQRAYISSYIVALNALDNEKNEDELKFYHTELNKLRKVIDEKTASGERTEKQTKNWLSMDTLRKIVRSMRKELVQDNVFSKVEITPRNKKELQDWVIANLFVGDDQNPPTRLDYSPMKIVSAKEYKSIEDKSSMNYLVMNGTKPFFSFNDYKTADKYGTREIKVGKHLFKVLKEWLKHNDGDYLLYNDNGSPMTPNQLGIRLKKIFNRTGKNITANLIRNIYISEKFPREEKIEREQVASKMGHSVATQQTQYLKKL